ncbi:MAG: hypothetical protein ACODAD_14790 [Planctomycetota bacterium]
MLGHSHPPAFASDENAAVEGRIAPACVQELVRDAQEAAATITVPRQRGEDVGHVVGWGRFSWPEQSDFRQRRPLETFQQHQIMPQ